MLRHPRKSELVALADGELPHAVSLPLRLHLWRCGRCRAAAQEVQQEQAAVSSALASLGSRASASDGWARFVTATGRQQQRRATAGVRAAIVLLLVASAALLLRSPGRARLGDLNEVARELAGRPEGARSRPAREGTADVRFVDVIDALRRTGQAKVVRDVCCADHDAEGPPDDGLLALNISKPATRVLVMYDDVDRSRSLSRGDLVRWVSLTPELRAMGSAPIQLASHFH